MGDFYTWWQLISAGLGTLTWGYFTFLTPSGYLAGLFEKIFLFAPLVIVPLALLLVRTKDRNGYDSYPYRISTLIQPFCAAGVVISYFFSPGMIAAIWTSGWFALTLLIALFGLIRFLSRPSFYVEEVCIDAGLIYIAIGGFWIFGSRLGIHPLGFDEIIILLTAIHFHYAGFAAPLLLGLIGRVLAMPVSMKWKVYRLSVGGIITGIPLLAMGITFSPLLEIMASFLLIISFLTISFCILFDGVPRSSHSLFSQIFLMIAGGSLVLSMILAGIYAYETFTQQFIIGIPRMARTHGIINAFGFIFCGLLGFSIIRPPSCSPRLGIPFSRLKSHGRVGADYFYRIKAVPTLEKTPTGLVDSLDEFRGKDFNPSQVDKEIRSFYEQTYRYNLIVQPHWTKGFKWSAKIYRKFANRMGQMCLPISKLGGELIQSKILPIDNKIDGRTNVRAWVRTYAASGDPVYIAAYSTHSERGEAYMNIAFPLFGGNLTSILKLQELPTDHLKGSNLSLTTLSNSTGSGGDEGVYFVNSLLPIRLPINETIRIWSASHSPLKPFDQETEKSSLIAQHEMWLFGIKFLTLDYYIYPV